MKLNLKSFKKVGGDEHTTTMRNSEGHEIKISHKGLHPATRGQLAALPMEKAAEEAKKPKSPAMAKGGAVKDPDDEFFAAKSREASTPLEDQAQSSSDNGEDSPSQSSDSAPTPPKGKSSGGAGEPKIDKKASEEIQRGATRSGWPFAEGGEVPISLDAAPLPENLAGINAPQLDASMLAPAAPQFYTDFSSGVPGFQGLAKDPVEAPSNIIQYAPEAVEVPVADTVRMPAAAAAPAPVAEAAPVAAPAPASPDVEKSMMASLGQLQGGIQKEGAALAAQGNAQAKILRENQAIERAAAADYQKNYQALGAERAALMEDIKQNHIDPNRYISNMSVGSKIATAIGLIASGMGAGMAHQENLASKFLSQQIENDINAQKAELGAKENLLSANLRQFGNMNDAMNMTRLMRSDMLSHQLQVEAAKAQGPLAKARLEQEAAKIQLQYAPLQNKIALNRTIGNMTAAAQADPSKAPALIQAVSQVDPARGKHLQETLVPGMGFANTPKDADLMKDMLTDASGAKQAIRRLKEINTISGKSLSPDLRAEAYSLSKSLVGQLNRAFTGGGPMSQGEQDLLASIAKNPTSFFALDSSNKKSLETLEKTLDTKVASAAKARGINVPDPVKQLPPQHQEWVKWARANPGNPKSQMILKKLGF